MSKVEFTEVTSDSLVGNRIGAQENDTSISKEDLGLVDKVDEESTVHVYIAFTDGVSIDQGIGIIEEKVCKGQSLQITRRDENSNAVVAIVSGADATSIEKLDEVSFIKIDKGAEKTSTATDTTSESARQDTKQSLEQVTESEEDNTEKNTEDEAVIEETESDNSDDTTLETISEVHDNNIDTNVKTVGITPIVIALILGLAIVIGIILHKANR